VPWLKAHQKAIDDAWLPTTEEKFQIYVTARQQFMEGGYVAIGMDHFGLPQDSISKAYREGKLTRNFQGYSVEKAEDMIGFGLTAIGYLEGAYFQNKKNLEEYQSSLSRGELPVERGYLLSQEDLRRRDAIQSLMCHFEIDKKFEELRPLIAEGLVEETETKFVATPLGRLLIRVVASKLDSYLHKGQFSRAV
jgi:oxygen-independent coproporphyrinogen-3 oxidase